MATFFNQATLSYNGRSVNSNIATGEIVEVLAANKTAVNSEYTMGAEVPYVINIINSGNAAYNGLTITDDLGAYEFGTSVPATTLTPLDYVDGTLRYFINGILQSATPTATQTSPLVITGVNVPADSVGTLAYVARVNAFAPEGVGATGIVNTATVSGGGLSTAIESAATVAPASEPNLSITKSVTPTTVAENGQVTYTFVIQNFGNTEATTTDNVVISDTFNPILTDLSVTYNGTVWATPTNFTYNSQTGLFETVAGAITVPAATFTQDPATGAYSVTPGTATLTVTGTI